MTRYSNHYNAKAHELELSIEVMSRIEQRTKASQQISNYGIMVEDNLGRAGARNQCVDLLWFVVGVVWLRCVRDALVRS